MAGQRLDDRVSVVTQEVKRLNLFMVAIVIVLFVAFAAAFIAVGAMVTSDLAAKQAVSEDTRDQIKEQNNKIDTLTQNITDLKKSIQDMQTAEVTQKTN